MIRNVKLGLLAGIFAIATVASAQSRVGVARLGPRPAQAVGARVIARSTTAAPRTIVRLPATPAVRRPPAIGPQLTPSRDTSAVFFDTNTGLLLSGATSFDLGQLLNNVPGLGFDYSHLAALNQNLAEKAFIDPVTQQELALSERLLQDTRGTGTVFPFFGGYPEGVVEEQPEQQQQPQVIVLQQPAPAEPAAEESASPAPPAAEDQAPLPDVGEFVLVLNNGKQIEAVAFTRQDDSVVYITKDGVRGSFPLSDLDTTATKDLNQKRGTPLQLSL